MGLFILEFHRVFANFKHAQMIFSLSDVTYIWRLSNSIYRMSLHRLDAFIYYIVFSKRRAFSEIFLAFTRSDARICSLFFFFRKSFCASDPSSSLSSERKRKRISRFMKREEEEKKNYIVKLFFQKCRERLVDSFVVCPFIYINGSLRRCFIYFVSTNWIGSLKVNKKYLNSCSIGFITRERDIHNFFFSF